MADAIKTQEAPGVRDRLDIIMSLANDALCEARVANDRVMPSPQVAEDQIVTAPCGVHERLTFLERAIMDVVSELRTLNSRL